MPASTRLSMPPVAGMSQFLSCRCVKPSVSQANGLVEGAEPSFLTSLLPCSRRIWRHGNTSPKCHDRRRFFAYFGRTPGRSQSIVKRSKKIKFHGAKMTKKNAKKNATPSNQTIRSADVNLGSRYGAIGIPAVAAALQFKSEVKNPAHVPPVGQKDEERQAEIAA
jgi:hypothetical protein